MSKYYKKKDWASLPSEMLSSLAHWGLTAERAVPSVMDYPFSMLQTPWYLREWVSENIPVELTDDWMVTLQRFNAAYSPFHLDIFRAWSYNCVIYGEGAVTHFKDRIDGEVVESVKYEKNKWYYHNGDKPHGVTDIPDIRIAVTIFKVRPDRVKPIDRIAGTAPLLAEEYKKDPYFYYV